MALAAMLTRRDGILPDGKPAPVTNVLILAAEDDASYAIKPRLKAHGADMSRVFILKAAARDELDSGHRTAQALDWNGGPWERALFLAIRDSFRADYRPRPGFEAAMVDLAAEAFGD